MIRPHLVRGLSLTSGTAIVVGTVIGTGIFLKTASMAQNLPSPAWILGAWIFAGVLSLAGGLVFAELATIFPEAGGEFVYLKNSFGELWGFLYGWMRFWIASPGSIAAYAVGAATFTHSGIVSLDFFPGQKAGLAISFIILFSLLNCLRIAFAGRIQIVLTSVKILIVTGVIGLIFSRSQILNYSELTAFKSGLFELSGFGSALIAALWAFDGWNNLNLVAGEIKNPNRNIPLAMTTGMAIILGLYLLANFAFLSAIPYQDIITSNSDRFPEAPPVAAKAIASFFGARTLFWISIAFVISALGAMYGSILGSARLPYAMAQEGLAFDFLGKLGEKSCAPINAILTQLVISCLLAASGSFDTITDYVVVCSWLFYGLTAACLFKVRKLSKAYQSPFYPVLPAVFIVMSALLVLNTFYTGARTSLIGIFLIALGTPFYFYKKRSSQA